MQVQILNGIYTDQNSDVRASYPKNLVPVPRASGVSSGFLRPADGIVEKVANCPGIDRGGIDWNGFCYRVMGDKLVRVNRDFTVTTIGSVENDGKPVSLDYSFSYLSIASNGKLWLYDGTTLAQNTDVDLGTVVDMTWVDGYFLTTDGSYLVITELNDPFSVNPFKYGSSEADPDEIKAVIRFRGEIYALNRHTVEVFQNTGGANFPFTRVSGAQVQRGVIGTHACAIFGETIAFLGSGRNESPAVYLIDGSNTVKVSTREIDLILSEYPEEVLASVQLETRFDDGLKYIYVHLPDQTLVLEAATSEETQSSVWYTLETGGNDGSPNLYRARNFVWIYDQWIVGDPLQARLGVFVKDVSSHWGQKVGWSFDTPIIYNESHGAVFHSLELVALPGRAAFGANPVITTCWSTDGMVWSTEKPILAGKQGQRNKRLVWMRQGSMRNFRIQRFKGDSDSHLSFCRLEATVEPLLY